MSSLLFLFSVSLLDSGDSFHSACMFFSSSSSCSTPSSGLPPFLPSAALSPKPDAEGVLSQHCLVYAMCLCSYVLTLDSFFYCYFHSRKFGLSSYIIAYSRPTCACNLPHPPTFGELKHLCAQSHGSRRDSCITL